MYEHLIVPLVRAWKGLLDSAEAFFEFAVVEFNQGRAAVGTGVRHGTGTEFFDEVEDFRFGEGIVGFDGVAADGAGDEFFIKSKTVNLVTGFDQFVQDIEDELSGVGDFQKSGQGVEEEGGLTEFAEVDSQSAEGGEVFPEEGGVAG